MFRTTHIRTKLAVALTIPLVALVGLAGFEVLSARQDVADAKAQAQLAASSVGPGSLVVNLQNERNRAAIDLIGLDDGGAVEVASNKEARALVDPAAKQFRSATASGSPEVQEAFAPAWTAIDDLEALRKDIDGYTGPHSSAAEPFANEVFQRYTDIIEAFFDGTSAVALTVDDSSLRNGVEIVDATTRQSEMRARIVRTLVLATITADLDSPAVRQEVAALHDRSRGFDEDIRTNASGPYDGVADATLAEAGVQSFNRQVEAYLGGSGVDVNQLLDSVKFAPDTGYVGLRGRTAAILSDAANDLQNGAAERQKVFALIALFALVLAVVCTWLASRSITRPLRSLQEQAEAMAGRGLPAGRAADPRHASRRGRRHPAGHPDHGEDARRGGRGGRRAQRRAEQRRRPGRGAGRAPPQHLRLVRQPRPTEPEPPQPPARLHHRPRAQRDRPRHPRGPVPPRPPRHPHAPQRRVAAGAGRASIRPASGPLPSRCPTSSVPRSARSRTTSGWSCAPRAGRRHRRRRRRRRPRHRRAASRTAVVLAARAVRSRCRAA